MNYLPIAVKLKNKEVIVVGGGEVSLRKIATLIETGAKVRIISPEATKSLQILANQGLVSWVKRKVRRTDIKKAALIVAATNDKAVNEHVSSWAHAAGIPINVVDKPALSDFISPAVLRKRQVLLAIYTDGRDPVLSRDLKNYLKERWDDFLLFRNRLQEN